MKFITVNYEKFESVKCVEEILQVIHQGIPVIPGHFSDVFDEELGTLPGAVHLTVELELKQSSVAQREFQWS